MGVGGVGGMRGEGNDTIAGASPPPVRDPFPPAMAMCVAPPTPQTLKRMGMGVVSLQNTQSQKGALAPRSGGAA